MREITRRRRRALVAGGVASAACLLVGLTPGAVSAGSPVPTKLPVEPKGLLGVLDTTSGAHKLVFDTSAGRYSLDGLKSDADDRRAIRMADGRTTPVFDFDALRLGPSTVVSVRGKNPLVVLSKGDVALATPLKLDGKAGANNGRGAGGGGGGGGGAVAILAKGTLAASSVISVNGGPGGVGNAHWGAIQGGDGGAGGVLLASTKAVELTGTISALSGGTTTGAQGPVIVAGPVAYGANAAVNGVAASKKTTLHAVAALPKGAFAVAGGSGGGGGGGTGLPEVVTPDYVKSPSAGGAAGAGGVKGGAGAYAVAGGGGGEGGFGLIAGGGGGGGGAYNGGGGRAGVGLVANLIGVPALDGTKGGAGLCAAAVAGGPGGAGGGLLGAGGAGGLGGLAGGGAGGAGAPAVPGPLTALTGGGGGGGGGAVGGAGGNGGAGNLLVGGGGGGGGADGCRTPAVVPPGPGGKGGPGGLGGFLFGKPGRNGAPGRWAQNGIAGVLLDPDGVDVDAGSVIGDPTKFTVPDPNIIKSPGAAGGSWQGGDGADGISTYDGSTETTDFSSFSLLDNNVSSGAHSNTQLVATFDVDGTIPGGIAPLAAADLPDASFVAFSYRAMYQNPTRQTNTPYVAATRVGTLTPIFGLNEHWGDGFHKFVAFEAVWLGDHWMHSASVGTYDPSPDGAFFFDELGVSHNGGTSWSTDDPCMPHGTTWSVAYPTTSSVTVTVDGVTRFSNIQAVGNCINDEYVKLGDSVTNLKALSTADSTVTLPVTIPLSIIPGFSDITSVGGFLFTSDYTEGNSRNVGTGATLALNTGDDPMTPCTNEGLAGNRLCLPFSTGLIGLVDTLGDGPRCWTPTVGGQVPQNPLWVPNQPCYIDDDNIPGPTGNVDPGERGTFLEEWWDTPFGFTA